MKMRILFLAMLCGCTTSSVPSGGVDGGVDAPRFDVPRFDAPGFDAPPTPLDTGPRDAGPVLVDGGPVLVDGGPIIVDAGGPDIAAGPDAGPPTCAPSGAYDLLSHPENSSLCSVVGSMCRVSRGGGETSLIVSCGGSRLECELGPECDCQGTTDVAGFNVSVRIDFPAQQATFSGAGEVCNFDFELNGTL